MAASHSRVATGGKSEARCRSSAPAGSSGMAALLDDFQQVTEGGGVGGLGMDEEDDGAARALAGRAVDQLEPVLLHVVVCLADIGDAQRDVRQSTTSAVLFNLPGDGGFSAQR